MDPDGCNTAVVVALYKGGKDCCRNYRYFQQFTRYHLQVICLNFGSIRQVLEQIDLSPTIYSH